MNSAAQVDLAKTEAPATQVLDSALGQAGAAPVIPEPTNASNQGSLSPENARRPLRGSSAITTPVRLVSKPTSRETTKVLDENVATSLESGNFGSGGKVHTLQPQDTGFGAWSYVAAAFSMYIVVWGFPQSFPIFQTHLSAGPKARFPGSASIRLLAPGLQDIEEGIMFQFLPKAARFRQTLVLVGIAIMVVSILIASYATKEWQIVMTQGVTFGIGGILLNFVHVSIFPEWFNKKQGKAMGIIWSGYQSGGLVFPLICQWLLEKHGFQETLRVLIAPMLALLLPSIVLLRGRYQAATVTSAPAQPPVSRIDALRTPNVLFYLFVALLLDLVLNVPKMFITTFAADVGLKGSDQALILSLHVLSNILSTYFGGWLSDSIERENLVVVTTFATSLSHFVLLGLAKTRAGLIAYAICVGLASGGFTNSLFTLYKEVSGSNGELFTTIHSLFSFFSGIAILSVGPVGAAILRLTPDIVVEQYAMGKYRHLVVYAGVLSFSSGMLVLGRKLSRRIRQPIILGDRGAQ